MKFASQLGARFSLNADLTVNKVKDNRTKRRPATINLLPFTVHSFLPCALSSMRFDSIVSSLSSAVSKTTFIYMEVCKLPLIPLSRH